MWKRGVFMGLFDFLRKKNAKQTRQSLPEQPKPEPIEVRQSLPKQPKPEPIEVRHPLSEQPEPEHKENLFEQEKPLLPYSYYTIYYQNGHVFKIIPPPPNGYYIDRDIVYSGTNIVSDGVKYDLTNFESISSIAIPDYKSYKPNNVGKELGVTGYLDYALRMRSGRYWTERKFDLSLCLQEKATVLMKYSDIGWGRKDFYRIVNEMRSLGYLKKAEEWKQWINKNTVDLSGLFQNSFRERLASAKELGTSLLEIGDIRACCDKCAKYRRRIYSIDGKDGRFPKFPKDFHLDCGLDVWPYVEGISEPSFNCSDIIKYSNRPFTDDRTEEEKEAYALRLKKIQQQQRYEYPLDLTKIIYYRLCILLPDDVPKSVSGFSRMKNANTKRYQELIQKAKAAGFFFPNPLRMFGIGQ